MTKLLIGFVLGLVVASVGFGGIARIMDGVNQNNSNYRLEKVWST